MARVGTAVAAVVLAVAGSPSADAAPGAAADATVPPVAWSPCPDAAGFDCATYRVPLDYARPADGTVTLALVRLPAVDPGRRIGSLFVNPGGPGASGVAFVKGAARLLYSDDIRASFDIVGFDPRGVGGSDPVQCLSSDEEAGALWGSVPAVPLTGAEINGTLSAYRTFTAGCGRRGGRLLAHLGTVNTARDLDRLRRAAGDRQLTFAGYSYGTLIGATYANLFPDRVRALLLDGMVDPEERTRRSTRNLLNRAGGFEAGFAAFLSACAGAPGTCSFAGGGHPAEKWAAMRGRLLHGPLVVPGAGQPVTLSVLTATIARRLYSASSFGVFADLLQAVYAAAFQPTTSPATGPVARELTLPPTRLTGEAYSYNAIDAEYAVNCVDMRLPRGQAAWPGLASRFEAAYPTFGRLLAFDAAPCGTWPVVAGERYAGPWNRYTAHPVLVVGTYYDPVTPYQFAVRATRELGRARLLSLGGYGHTSIGSSGCVDARVTAYLLTTRVPPAGTVCQPDHPPF
jgi:pimeloyl-ACP methyl ester carboxylesterase